MLATGSHTPCVTPLSSSAGSLAQKWQDDIDFDDARYNNYTMRRPNTTDGPRAVNALLQDGRHNESVNIDTSGLVNGTFNGYVNTKGSTSDGILPSTNANAVPTDSLDLTLGEQGSSTVHDTSLITLAPIVPPDSKVILRSDTPHITRMTQPS